MAVNGVTGGTNFAAPTGAASAFTATMAAETKSTQNELANLAASYDYTDSYEKDNTAAADPTKSVYTRDMAKVAELKASDQAYLTGLRNLVNELLNQLGMGQMADGSNITGGLDPQQVNSYWDLLVDNGDGTYSFRPEISPEAQEKLIAKAQEDIGENGYYGVSQTSQRILDYAKAITGGDPSKIGDMRKMAQAAFDDVAKLVGGWDNLPDVSKQTYNTVMKGFDEWETSSQVNAATSNQAAAAEAVKP